MKRIVSSIVIAGAVIFSACTKEKKEEQVQNPVNSMPETYSFERNGASTVAYSGQTERIAMLSAIGSYLNAVNTGGTVEAQELSDMFANQNGAFANEGYSKDLKSKCASPADASFYENLFIETETASKASATASNGTAGLILKRNSTSGYLVNANGLEYRQIILKGLMGSVFYYRAVEEYLGQGLLADDNNNLVDGKNYTQMEHHYDEAFGYIGIAPDLSNADTDPKDQTRVNFWGEYIVKRHIADDSYPMVGVNELILDAFIKGRHAIVEKNYEERDAAIKTIAELMERVCANNALGYLEDAKGDTDTAARLHHLSEAIGFLISMNAHLGNSGSEAMFPRVSDQSKIDAALDIVGLESNLWDLSNAEIDQAIGLITSAFPSY